MIEKTIATGGCIFLLAGALSGCRSPHYGDSTFWIFVPNYAFDAKDSHGFPAEVVLTPQECTTNRIAITINGEVMSPGERFVPERCSILQAIGYAGGFAPTARATRIRIQDRAGATRRLVMQIREHNGHRRIWYEVQRFDNSPNELDAAAKTDFIVHNGDAINISRAVW